MADTGSKVLGAAANDTSVGTRSWTISLINLQSSNEAGAQANLSTVGDATTYYLKATNFGFSLNANAVVLGIELTIERLAYFSGGGKFVVDSTIKIVDDAGTVVGNNKAAVDQWPSTQTAQVYGGATDVWGISPSPEMVNSSNFGFVISATLRTPDGSNIVGNVSYITAKVYYGFSGASSSSMTMSSSASGTSAKVASGSATIQMSGLAASGATRIETNASRKVVQSTQVSWKKSFVSSYRLFAIGVSTIGGGDFIASDGAVSSDWNKYLYDDESDNVLSLSYERELNMPLGGMTRSLADVELDNTSGRYLPDYLGGVSAISTAILPRRPIIINAGFHYNGVDNMSPQFVGLLKRQPEINLRDRTANLEASDFISFIDNKFVDRTAMFTGLRSDQVIENLLSGLGFSTAQYDLDTGINTIPFGILEKGDKISDVINQLVQAEAGNFYQDELGILHFHNRQHWTNPPFTYVTRVINTGMVLDAYAPNEDHIINVVEVNANPREKQPTGEIYSQPTFIELSTGDNEVFINYANPVLEAANPSYTANTQSDGSGSNVTAQVALKSVTNFAQASKYVFTNNSGAIAYITVLTVQGREATPIYEDGLYYRAQDDSSVTAYEERGVTITNDYIQSQTWAESYAALILQQFAEPEALQTIRIRAIPSLYLGALISWQGRNWRVYGIKTTIDPSVGFVQELNLLQRTVQTYFRIGISTIGGSDQIAP